MVSSFFAIILMQPYNPYTTLIQFEQDRLHFAEDKPNTYGTRPAGAFSHTGLLVMSGGALKK